MKRKFLSLIVSMCLFQASTMAAEDLINIDFTRDSTEWKSEFPVPSWNTAKTDLSISVKNLGIVKYKFTGTFGKFNPGGMTKAQPVCMDDRNKNRRWAFRLDKKEANDSYLELPEIPSAGKLTIYCKNGNADKEAIFYVQRKKGQTWETLRTIYVAPHYEQNYELQMEEYLQIASRVTLRLSGATKNIHIFAIDVKAYDASQPKEKPLRLVLMPDAQTYANREALNPVYGAQTAWMANHSDSIMFVLQQGDLTQTNGDAQWKIAAGALTLMDGKKLPYTFVSGNHDVGEGGKTTQRVTDMMNKYLPYSRYCRSSYFGGSFEENKMDNAWFTFSSGDYKFLILSLEFGPRNKVLEWAKKVIKEHPQYNVMINTHAYMYDDDTRMGSQQRHFDNKIGLPQRYGIGADTGDEYANNGQEIWDKLVKLYPNCLFVFSGHVLGRGFGHQISEGVNGNKVYQFLANYQGGVAGSQEDRNGMLRIVDMDPVKQTLSIKTYSPYTNRYNTDEGQHFFFDHVAYIKGDTKNSPQAPKNKK